MTQILSAGGITLEHCTVTDDGVACALEFNAVAFGQKPLTPQAGVAVRREVARVPDVMAGCACMPCPYPYSCAF